MSPARKTLLAGTATFAVGLVLWLSGGGIEIPVFAPVKVSVVLMVAGALEALYGVYRTARER